MLAKNDPVWSQWHSRYKVDLDKVYLIVEFVKICFTVSLKLRRFLYQFDSWEMGLIVTLLEATPNEILSGFIGEVYLIADLFKVLTFIWVMRYCLHEVDLEFRNGL